MKQLRLYRRETFSRCVLYRHRPNDARLCYTQPSSLRSNPLYEVAIGLLTSPLHNLITKQLRCDTCCCIHAVEVSNLLIRFCIIIIFIHRSHGRWIQNNKKCTKKEKKKKKKTDTHNSPAVPSNCINVAIIIMQKNIYLFNVTLAEFNRHDCRISESSLVSLTTNMLHNLFCDTVIFSRNFHMRPASSTLRINNWIFLGSHLQYLEI